MKLRVLGCAGGESPEARATAFLIDDRLLLDAGSVMSSLSVAAQARIDHILITHPHLDHIKDLGFIMDNTFGMRDEPIQVVAPTPVLDDLKAHIFNWVIWPDFSVLPSRDNPVMTWLPADVPLELSGIRITAFKVNHPGNAYGYLLENLGEDVSILVSGDTARTEQLWEIARQQDNLAAVFVDVAFPDRLGELAESAGHYSPTSFAAQYQAFEKKDLPFYVYHMKPACRDEVAREIEALGLPQVNLLQEGDRFNFASSSITGLKHKVRAIQFC